MCPPTNSEKAMCPLSWKLTPVGRKKNRGYSLEVFNAVGETLAVVTVRESQIEPLTNNEVLHVRRLNEVSV